MNQVRVPAQIIPGSVTAADGHLRDAHLLLEKAGDPFVAEGVKAQFRESQPRYCGYLSDFCHAASFFSIYIVSTSTKREDSAMRVEGEIKRWGNSLALRISGAMAEIPQFRVGSKLAIDVSEDGLIIKKVDQKRKKFNLPYSEQGLLAGMTPDKAHADDLATPTTTELGH